MDGIHIAHVYISFQIYRIPRILRSKLALQAKQMEYVCKNKRIPSYSILLQFCSGFLEAINLTLYLSVLDGIQRIRFFSYS